MTSRNVEDHHLKRLRRLLEDSNLVCERTEEAPAQVQAVQSLPEEPSTEEDEEEEQQKEMVSHEEHMMEEELSKSVAPIVFPSPSLRLVLSDRTRSIQRTNCIQPLPEKFKLHFDPEAIPIIAETDPKDYIDMIAELVGCSRYPVNLPEYWFLDTMANLLRRAQRDRLDRQGQAVLMQWFIQWILEVQYFDAANRKRMMKRFEANMISAALYIVLEEKLPTPAECGIYYKAPGPDVSEVSSNIHEASKKETMPPADTRAHVTFGKNLACCLMDLTMIIHYIFDLFSSDFQYDLVRSVFTFPPEYVMFDSPYQLQACKQSYSSIKVKTKKEKSPKTEKPKGKGKAVVEETNKEYLDLMKLKAKEEAELDELDEKEQEEQNLRQHLLPLSMAVDDHYLDRYWPPPPSPEPEVVVPVTTRKGKK